MKATVEKITREYAKGNAKNKTVLVRISEEVHAKLKKYNLNAAAICRDALIKITDKLE